jgi:hypothetical protein
LINNAKKRKKKNEKGSKQKDLLKNKRLDWARKRKDNKNKERKK